MVAKNRVPVVEIRFVFTAKLVNLLANSLNAVAASAIKVVIVLVEPVSSGSDVELVVNTGDDEEFDAVIIRVFLGFVNEN